MIAVVTGMIATYGVGGVAWDYGQYAVGLERLGFDVFYLEDTGAETYDPRKGEFGTDGSYVYWTDAQAGTLTRNALDATGPASAKVLTSVLNTPGGWVPA